MFVKNFLCSKSAEFYLRRINKRSYELQDVIQNNGKHNIDWNKFIVKLFMSQSYLTKTEITYDTILYIYTHTHTHIYIYIYIYIEREREIDR